VRRVNRRKRATAGLDSMPMLRLVAIASVGGSPFVPPGAGAATAECVLTFHGTEAELVPRRRRRADRAVAEGAGLDTSQQIDVGVARSAWDPGSDDVRLAAGVGLRDESAGSYLVPGRSGC
jgi:hypothetical protein